MPRACHLVATVHDELIFDAPVEALAYCELARAVESSGRYLSGNAENETASLPGGVPTTPNPTG